MGATIRQENSEAVENAVKGTIYAIRLRLPRARENGNPQTPRAPTACNPSLVQGIWGAAAPLISLIRSSPLPPLERS